MQLGIIFIPKQFEESIFETSAFLSKFSFLEIVSVYCFAEEDSMWNVLNHDSIKNAAIIDQPFPYLIIDNIIRPEHLLDVVKGFPNDVKQYRNT